MKTINSKTVLFIHGAFVTKDSWGEWPAYFKSKGYNVVVPAWPHKDAPAAELRKRHPDANIASIRLGPLIDYFAGIASGLPEKPIIVGHSLGGLMTQILVYRGLAAAGVAVHSVPPQGIFPTQLSFFKSTTAALGFFTDTKKTYLMDLEKWRYAFTNGMPPDVQQRTWEQHAAPESKLLLRDGLTSVAKVDFKKPHVPLLLLAGDADNCVPAGLNLSNLKAYKDKDSVTDFTVLPGRNHFVMGQPTWKEDADHILKWIDAH